MSKVTEACFWLGTETEICLRLQMPIDCGGIFILVIVIRAISVFFCLSSVVEVPIDGGTH